MAQKDSARYTILASIIDYYNEGNRDSALYYANKAFNIANKNNQTLDEAYCLDDKGYILMHMGKFPESLASFQDALQLVQDSANEYKTWTRDKKFTFHQNYLSAVANIHHDLGHLMGSTGNTDQQIAEYRETRRLATEAGDRVLLGFVNMNLGNTYRRLGRLDSALIMEQHAETIFKQTVSKKYLGMVYNDIANIYLGRGNRKLALVNFYKALIWGTDQKQLAIVTNASIGLTNYYLAEKQKDSSLFYARKAFGVSKSMGTKDLGLVYENLYKSYALAGRADSAYKYQGLALEANDSTYKTTIRSLADFQKLAFKSQMHEQELEKEKEATKTRIRTGILISAVAVLMLLALIFYRNNRQKQKVNHLLSRQNEEILQQKEEIESQRDHLEQAFDELKNTQTQLIQREKMASLGELTAGIAHEIQNPLNFVNNFSEVNKEMLEELKAERQKPKTHRDEQLEIELINDLVENEQKINHHGKRADAIVKGMLQHSSSSSGQKEPTDINALADEYLRLAYHGLRAKNKDFNAELITHFDEKLSKVNVIPQDMGRVLLNVINNAFYAVQQKTITAGKAYNPTVEISTAQQNGFVMVSVKDNGTGISDSVKDKIMQPFFTTKPTGEGTGLGLSLSYDIVVKGHGGKISVESREGEGSEFTISLPA
ncbi:MAG: GHKL domain-containing protein [Bacteroidetes bacterium]|nr:GHKL domain-containing protein [Bacteroidota bacterium]